MREKQIPVDSVEMKEPIHAFAWEPVGSKFAIIHGEIPSVNVSFYGVRPGLHPDLLSKLLIFYESRMLSKVVVETRGFLKTHGEKYIRCIFKVFTISELASLLRLSKLTI